MDEVFDGQQLLSLTPYYPSSASLRSAPSPQGEGFATDNLRPQGEAFREDVALFCLPLEGKGDRLRWMRCLTGNSFCHLHLLPLIRFTTFSAFPPGGRLCHRQFAPQGGSLRNTLANARYAGGYLLCINANEDSGFSA